MRYCEVMTSFQQTLVVAFMIFWVFTTNTVRARPVGRIGAEPVYQQQIIINPLEDETYSGTNCNCSTIQEIVSDVIQNTTCQLAELETNIASKVDGVSAELTDVKLQLDQIKESVSELTELLKNATVTPPRTPKDCSEAFANGVTTSGVYTIQPVDAEGPFSVYCDMETDGGGWTVFQRRQDGSVDFYRDWVSYRQGFGDLNGEFWLGNDNLHRLTAQGAYRLRVDLKDFENNSAYAEYDMFRVADGSDNYRLTVQGFSGTAGDSLSRHSNLPFTTRDSDDSTASNCAIIYTGAWWYDECHSSNLNGLYLGGQTDVYAKGVVWQDWKGYYYSLKRTEMKMKAANS
ncbi:microfibril-associated glycoprotein 4-like [Acanthaster planci]|uniref:Microfibril-associated glycoprotein 4-like n=1 Tax=Acanthaster planci TaxID=133434 RepID=A0A8B7ZV69_ACAPL|nr:microfibril-associated glycoprotein 4-like [Acanthaster planci]